MKDFIAYFKYQFFGKEYVHLEFDENNFEPELHEVKTREEDGQTIHFITMFDGHELSFEAPLPLSGISNGFYRIKPFTPGIIEGTPF